MLKGIARIKSYDMGISLTLLFYIATAFIAPPKDFTPFEMSNGKNTATYEQAIDYYKYLDKKHKEIKLLEYGSTDAGKPLHLVVISKEKIFNPVKIKEKNKRIILINNAIHPGEPCGVDASMMLARDVLKKKEFNALLDHVVIIIIPVYNIGGALNRSCCTRANQVGPEEQGFRGNAKNLDLNRDFIKADSKNARTFHQIFQEWQPDIFLDTHTTNGADYQHVMTLISTQKDKLHPILSEYMQASLEPSLYSMMAKDSFPITPYVFSKEEIPDSGLIGFLETPRYATGYAALFNTIGFTTEAHMLKPFDERVWATYYFMKNLLQKVNEDSDIIGKLRTQANELVSHQTYFPLNWKWNTEKYKEINFLGYESSLVPSKVSGLPVIFYDREKLFSKEIRFYDTYDATDFVEAPQYYVIPQAWSEVIDRLILNKVNMPKLSRDTTLEVEVYYIDEYSTLDWPYEGHYLHYKTSVQKERIQQKFHKGDYVIPMDQIRNRFIVETLEPVAGDSYFNWNFFDAILMQKEYFSSYVFDETAARILNEDPALKAEFDKKILSDSIFKHSLRTQLEFIYKRSSYFEKSYGRYPVVRIMEKMTLPLEK